MNALHTFAMRLAANDDLPQALETIVEVRNYYEQRSKSRNGVSMSLACALYSEGILYCATGRHDEGCAAMTKLQELLGRLDIALPELAERTRLQLAKEQTYPSTISLLTKLNLRCGHQEKASQA
ncbi:hypothetical protein CVT25_003890 [Psilocybe cyanescens]|uniref:Uncharacterized protein n=1 Tax=Psilocybe cyanescens TaxID=93625 RepID=A0A409W343_PSICY|nr:hypothetical protein CVT25_003890 [Psilocybe cyanescens]